MRAADINCSTCTFRSQEEDSPGVWHCRATPPQVSVLMVPHPPSIQNPNGGIAMQKRSDQSPVSSRLVCGLHPLWEQRVRLEAQEKIKVVIHSTPPDNKEIQ
jgi:hypothetical protein